ncbi:hypothetical protein KY290_034456 [Solanum tuberosum]|uniref:Integrase core domain containing protein n=1 Tax=Solanum tuberosum TaxID=4113 RepID=A0ABQ7U4J9_SOLTU|nr:hypothetical protein KY289_031487 [Solanum tuberosum]KAH0741413.1 hypothetical protein KY290_034456 [Solanum tuberosum]
MDEFVKQMMHVHTNHLLPILVERVQASITPAVPPATTNVDENVGDGLATDYIMTD